MQIFVTFEFIQSTYLYDFILIFNVQNFDGYALEYGCQDGS